MVSTRVVTWEPKNGEYREGQIISREEAPRVAGLGGCSLPVDRTHFDEMAGNSAYSRRAWGNLDLGNSPRSLAFCSIFKPFPGSGRLFWMARLEPLDAARVLMQATQPATNGILRAAALTYRSGQSVISISSGGADGNGVVLSTLRENDLQDGGWLVGGQASIGSLDIATFGIGLYGYGEGMRVRCAAFTLTP